MKRRYPAKPISKQDSKKALERMQRLYGPISQSLKQETLEAKPDIRRQENE